MATPQVYGLSAEDVAVLKAMADEYRRRRGPDPRAPEPQEDSPASDTYVALTPAGGIPARSGTAVGYADCLIYQVLREFVGTASPTLVPVGPLSQTVHNPGSAAVAAGEYVPVHKDKFGTWLVPSASVPVSDIYARTGDQYGPTASAPNRAATATGTASLAFVLGSWPRTTTFLACIAQDTTSGSGITAPAGWYAYTPTGASVPYITSGNLRLYLFYRVAGGNSGFQNLGTQTFLPVSGAPAMAGAVYSFFGYGAPCMVQVRGNTGTGTTASTGLNITAFPENCRIVHVFANLDSTPGTPQAPLTALTGTAGASASVVAGWEDQKQGGVGTIGRTATLPSSVPYAAFAVALRPAPIAHDWYEVELDGAGNFVDKAGGLSGSGNVAGGSFLPLYGPNGEPFQPGTFVRAMKVGSWYVGLPLHGLAVELYDAAGSGITDARDNVPKLVFAENDGFFFSTISGFLLVGIQDASTTQTGVVHEGPALQTFGGDKAFNGDVQTNRHIGGNPNGVWGGSLTLGTGLGGAGANGSVNGSDVCGSVSLTAGAGAGGGTLATVTYKNQYGSGVGGSARVVLTPTNANAAGLGSVWVDSNASGSSFVLHSSAVGLTVGQTYTWDFHVLGR